MSASFKQTKPHQTMHKNLRPILQLLVPLLLLQPLAGCVSTPSAERGGRAKALRGSFGTYDAEPRRPDGRVDVERLVRELSTIHANTYNWLVWHAATDWEDLQLFLPLAGQNHIKVWVTLVPPSESPPRTKKFSEPFRLDYEQWAAAIARLSLQQTNLVAWSIDDFSANCATFTPERLGTILDGARAINPKLAFVPCCYFRQVTPQFAQKYSPLLDGILFPYRHESGIQNLHDAGPVKTEIAKLKELLGPAMPIFVDVYATRHVKLNEPTPEYVREVMTRGWHNADGVLIYCHQYQDSSPAKYQVIKQLFESWDQAR
jgi:hypothetical protein